MAAVDGAKNVSITGTTLNLNTDEAPVTTETIGNSYSQINPFDAKAKELQQTVVNQPTKTVSIAQNNATTPLFGDKFVQQQEFAAKEVTQTAAPSFSTWGKQLLRGILRYDRAINGGKVAHQTIPPESDIYYAAASNYRIHEILRQMNQEWAN